MLRLFPYITLGLLVYILYIYIDNYYPNAIDDLIIRADVFKYSPIAKKEYARQDAINRLEYDAYGKPIGTLEKQVLINHTVFIGATAQMVEYALDAPAQVVFRGAKLYYVYFLAGDKRPTVFEFVCAKNDPALCNSMQDYKQNFGLSKAYKKSTIDLGNLDEDSPAPAR